MKALLFAPSVPRYLLSRTLGKRTPLWLVPLRFVEIPSPVPPEGWVRVRVRLAGICGSDLALLFGKSSPRLSPFFSFPAILGHEILGEANGKRVVVNPLLACRERGLALCPSCAAGEEGLCLNVAEGRFSPGMLGYCRDLPGGWAEEIVVHPARLHPVPDGVPDERAVLAEPLAVVLRGLRLLPPDPDVPILIIGAGTIGLLILVALGLLGHRGPVHVLARHSLQARLARELGATGVHREAGKAAAAVGARKHRPVIGPPVWRGGFPYVIDAAGSSSSFAQALALVGEGGAVLLLGGTGQGGFDLSPLWFRGIRIQGSYTYSAGDFCRAMELLSRAEGMERVLTHVFPLAAWREAIGVIRRREAVKAAFRPG